MRAVSKRLRGLTVLVAVLLAALSGPTAAQPSDWPAKPMRFVVPFPPGGTIDPLARLIADRLKQQMGWTIVVENRAGASGSIGTAAVAKAQPDGYTFGLVFDTHAVNPGLLPNLAFDTQKDLDPVSIIGTTAMVLSTHESRQFTSIDALLAAARTKADAVVFGTVGNGSLAHLAIKQLERSGGFQMLHVPHNGGGPLLTAALGGSLDSFMTTIAAQMSHIRSGKMRPLAVTGERRSPLLPEVPTLAEKGFPGFAAYSWWGLVAPARTPPAMVQAMQREVRRALEEPTIRAQLEQQWAMTVWTSTPDEMRRFVASEIDRWGRVIRENGIRTD